MKKMWCLMGLILVLYGCGQQEVLEQLEDVYEVISLQPEVLLVDLPEEAAATVMGSGQNHAIYFCDGYTLTIQTMPSGDLERTVMDITGFKKDHITMVQTDSGVADRYEAVWVCAGEAGDQVGRFVLLDDGAYHYVVTVMADAGSMSELRLSWDTVLDSVSLQNTGSSLPHRAHDIVE